MPPIEKSCTTSCGACGKRSIATGMGRGAMGRSAFNTPAPKEKSMSFPIPITRCVPALLLLVVCAAAGAAAETPPPDPEGTIQKININTATFDELQALKGVGPALAGRILQHRKDHGLFEKIEELMTVRGIGEKSYLKFRNRITVGETAAREN